MLKNQVIAAAIPLGTQLFTAINQLMPTFTQIIGFVAKLIEGFTNLNPTVQKIILIAVALLAALGPIITVVGTVMTVVGALSAALPVLGAALALLLSPIGLIVLAVVGLYLAWKTNFFGFRDITQSVIDSVLGFFGGLVSWFTDGGLSGIVDTFWDVATALIDAGVSFMVWYVTLPIQIAEVLKDIIAKVVAFVADFVGNFEDLPGKITGIFSGIYDGMWSIGYNIIAGIIDGISYLWNQFSDKIDGIAGKVGGLFDKLHINSPSKVTMEIGKGVMEGVILGVDRLMPDLEGRMDDVAGTVSGMDPQVPVIPAQVGAGAGLGGGLSVTFAEGAIQVSGADDPQAVADAVGGAIVAKILSAMDGMGTVAVGAS